MKAAFITFALVAASSAAAVAIVATGAFDGKGAANAARPGFTDPDDLTTEEVRQRALDARKNQKEAELPPDAVPAIVTTSSQPILEEAAADALGGTASRPTELKAPLQNNSTPKMTKEEIREIPEIRKKNDPYANPQAPSINTDANGKTIINTSPYPQ